MPDKCMWDVRVSCSWGRLGGKEGSEVVIGKAQVVEGTQEVSSGCTNIWTGGPGYSGH